MLVEKISEFLNNKEQMPSGEMVSRILKSLTENFDYKSAIIADRHGEM